jgi:hypothetical protein
MLVWIGDHVLVAAGLLLASATFVWLAWLLWGYPSARSGFRVLTAREQALARAAAEAFFPPDGPIPVSGVQAGCVRYLDRYLARSRLPQRRLLLLLLWFNEYAPLLFGPVHRRFSRMNVDQRLAYLADAEASSVYLRRVTVLAMRGLITFGYFDNDNVLQFVGMKFDTDPFNLSAVREAVAVSAGDSVPVPLASGERLKPGLRAPADEEFSDVG